MHMLWRLVRSLLFLLVGVLAGFAAAGAVLRGWLPSHGDETSDTLELVAIFDGIELRSRATEFRGGTILAWFGGIALDLSEATLAPDARLDVRAAIGGVAIKVPPGWRIDAETSSLIGGIDVGRGQPDDPDAPTLAVRATTVIGGVSIGSGSVAGMDGEPEA
jgi:hypothetical protein